MKPAWPPLALAAGFIGFAGLFAHFGSELVEGELRGVDLAVRSAALRVQSPASHAMFTGITEFGVSGVLVAVCLLPGWRLFRQSGQQLVVIAACALLSGALVGLLKRPSR